MEPVDPAIRATVEFLVAETARPDDVASAASEAWAARQTDDAAAQSISKLGVEMVSMLERDVRKTPPSVAAQLDITAPTAKANALIRKILGAAPKRSRSERDVRDEARAARRAARSPMKPRAAMKPRIYGWRAPRLFTADL